MLFLSRIQPNQFLAFPSGDRVFHFLYQEVQIVEQLG